MLIGECGLPPEYEDTLRMADPPENILQSLKVIHLPIGTSKQIIRIRGDRDKEKVEVLDFPLLSAALQT